MSVAGALFVWAAASVPAALVVGAFLRAGRGGGYEPIPSTVVQPIPKGGTAVRALSEAFRVPGLSRPTLDAHPAQRAAQVGLDEARERELGEFQAETARLRDRAFPPTLQHHWVPNGERPGQDGKWWVFLGATKVRGYTRRRNAVLAADRLDRQQKRGKYQPRPAAGFDQCGVCASFDGHLPDCPAAGA